MIPVLDKTGLVDTYDFTVAVRPELGVDPLTLWQEVLREQLGLRIESRRAAVEVVVVDYADTILSAN
jgi:uncharacterized protein (TIGR03435 family)